LIFLNIVVCVVFAFYSRLLFTATNFTNHFHLQI
jgi:hypothetical protein